MNENYVAQVTGTGANIDVYCGFKPARVRVVNVDATQIDTLDWIIGMADDNAIRTAAGTRSKITTGGIRPLESATLGLGFRVGNDTAVNVTGQKLVIFAERGGEGNQAP